MTCSDLEGIASSDHDLERSPKCGLSRKGIHADIENPPIALAPCPTIGTTPLPRGTNHTRSQTDLYFRQLLACVLLPRGCTPMDRIPASERTRERLKSLIEGPRGAISAPNCCALRSGVR